MRPEFYEIYQEDRCIDCLKKFLRDESGTAEVASSVAMIGKLSSFLCGISLSGIMNDLIDNHLLMILVVFVLVFVYWIIFKA
jgi:Flp pilus assembly pilin Flp